MQAMLSVAMQGMTDVITDEKKWLCTCPDFGKVFHEKLDVRSIALGTQDLICCGRQVGFHQSCDESRWQSELIFRQNRATFLNL
jgi:hypothetical protein